MVGVFAETFFASRELFQAPLCVFRATFLQALTQAMMTLARLFNCQPAEGFTLAISSQVDDTEINTESLISGSRCWGWNFQRHRQGERPIAIEQVSLSLDAPQTGLLVLADQER